jgi:hypothetical protein
MVLAMRVRLLGDRELELADEVAAPDEANTAVTTDSDRPTLAERPG